MCCEEELPLSSFVRTIDPELSELKGQNVLTEKCNLEAQQLENSWKGLGLPGEKKSPLAQ